MCRYMHWISPNWSCICHLSGQRGSRSRKSCNPITSVRMWIAIPDVPAVAVAVHYAENVIGWSWSTGWKQLRLMLNGDSSSSSSRRNRRIHIVENWMERGFPYALLWQEIDAPSSDAAGFVCASTRTSCRVINARQSQHKRQPDKALPLPRCPVAPSPRCPVTLTQLIFHP